jgi:hypothetical protein
MTINWKSESKQPSAFRAKALRFLPAAPSLTIASKITSFRFGRADSKIQGRIDWQKNSGLSLQSIFRFIASEFNKRAGHAISDLEFFERFGGTPVAPLP